MPSDDPAVDASRFPLKTECQPELLLPHQNELAREAFEEFLNALSAQLGGYLSAPIEFRFVSSRQSQLASLPTGDAGSYRVPLELQAIPGQAYLILSRDIASAALELMLGAPAEVPAEPRESFSDLDLHVLGSLIELIAGELRTSWQSLGGATFKPVFSTEKNARVEPNGQSVLEMCAEVTLRGCTGSLQFVVPSLLIRLASDNTVESATTPASPPRDSVEDALDSASVRIDAVLRGSDIRIRDLLRLKPGMVLELPCEAGTSMECQVNGIVKMRGSLVADGSSVAFQIQEIPVGESSGAAAHP